MKFNTEKVKFNPQLKLEYIRTEHLPSSELDTIKNRLHTFITTLEHEMRSVGVIENMTSALKAFEELYSDNNKTKIIIRLTDSLFTTCGEENEFMVKLTLTYITDVEKLTKTNISPLVRTVIDVKNLIRIS